MLSTRDLQLAMGIEHASLFTPYSKVWLHGSWIRHAYWTVRTSSGRIINVYLNASMTIANGEASITSRPIVNGAIMGSTKKIDDMQLQYRRNVLTVTTPLWKTRAQVTRGKPHHGVLRINLQIQPLYDAASDKISPHGLLGQTYDKDPRPLHGKQDRYDILDDGRPTKARVIAGGRITTRAKAEGAIEGNGEMYRIHSPFDTNFTFSRFGAKAAAPRNTSLMRMYSSDEQIWM